MRRPRRLPVRLSPTAAKGRRRPTEPSNPPRSGTRPSKQDLEYQSGSDVGGKRSPSSALPAVVCGTLSGPARVTPAGCSTRQRTSIGSVIGGGVGHEGAVRTTYDRGEIYHRNTDDESCWALMREKKTANTVNSEACKNPICPDCAFTPYTQKLLRIQ